MGNARAAWRCRLKNRSMPLRKRSLHALPCSWFRWHNFLATFGMLRPCRCDVVMFTPAWSELHEVVQVMTPIDPFPVIEVMLAPDCGGSSVDARPALGTFTPHPLVKSKAADSVRVGDPAVIVPVVAVEMS